MAHAQKPDFVFRRKGQVYLNRRGRQFSRLLAAEVSASAVVILDTPCSEVVWRVLAIHSIRQFPLHFPSRASTCAITFQLDSTLPKVFWTINNDLPKIQILPCDQENNFYVETDWTDSTDRAMPQAIIFRPLTSEARIHSELSPRKFCGEQSRKGTGFSHVILFTLLLHFTSAPYFFIHPLSALYHPSNWQHR